ncbi:cation diffusion facilitator family transporter [Humibacter ginsenosidimutans]|uniref:Cation transporter n=1 Tax=Humibacter ginsenosidimutans TaxID=2599293 RepID=A0A5B8M1R8_9MICO|nr:cation diffusion facilitator family transporter [Humibacter ginsenosidimutans]QDZ14293.1 cation transporter [Humibacter ginsenosidimutans]
MTHSHEHSGAHDHGAHGSSRRRLLVVICIVLGVFVLEIVGALLSGSLALLADAGHLVSDLVGLIVALVAATIAARPATDRQTFGFQRVEVFGALVNSLILIGVAVSVAIGAALRFGGHPEVHSGWMLGVAVVGLIGNVTGLLVLRGGAKSSINMRGAYLEVLGDAFGSLATIAAAIVILTTGFAWADAIASIVIAVLIVPRAYSLLREVVRVLSESAPASTDVAEIREHLLGTDGVVAVHDVHVWAITSGAPVFSAHVVVQPQVFAQGRAGALLDELGGCLNHHFDVAHSTFRLEPAEHAAHEGDTHR